MTATAGRMIHRARIERDSNTTADAYGQPDVPTWAATYTAQPCYLWQPIGQRGEITGERNADIYDHRLLVPLTVDVTEEDRINGITNRRGATISDSVYNIRQIVRKPDHLLLVLETVQS